MNVFFFPFSHVDETQRTTLNAFFSQFIFLPLAPDLSQSPAMVPLVENGTAVPLFISGPRLDEVASQVNVWMNWAALHKGNKHNLKNLIQDNPYLTDHLGAAPIQSEIRARMADSSRKPADNRMQTDPLLFSIIARITDAQNETIDQALTDLEEKQTALFSQLRGDSEPGRSENTGSFGRDPGDIMTRARIRAWATCAVEENLFSKQSPLILATTSAAVFEQVTANAAQVINALDIDDIKVHEDGCDHQPAWQKQLLNLFGTLADGPADDIQAQTMLNRKDDACRRTGRIQVQTVEGPDLENRLNLPGRRLLVCRVSLKP